MSPLVGLRLATGTIDLIVNVNGTSVCPCLTSLHGNVLLKLPETRTGYVRSRIAELRAEVKPPIDVNSVAATIAAIDAQMANLFALAQHASSQKTIDSLGMMMQALENKSLKRKPCFLTHLMKRKNVQS